MSPSPEISDTLRKQLDSLPTEPGVYIFTDTRTQTVYVGKATNLRSRVRSYFQAGADDGRFLFSRIVKHTASIDFIVCTNELEALLLENNLIKKHRPRYNLRLRDDKTYLSLRVTTAEAWPRVHPIRRWKDDGHLYFGPYSSSRAVHQLIRLIKKYIPLRSCSNAFFDSRQRPCIEYEIGRCTAPCVGLDDEESYAKMVEEVLLLLRGRDRSLLDLLQEKMKRASEARDYEDAARIRDQINAVEKIMERQHVEEHSQGDCDVIGLHRSGGLCSIHQLLVRDGRVISSATHTCRDAGEPDATLLQAFIGQYYHGDKFVPKEILVPAEPQGLDVILTWLASKAGRRVVVKVPKRGSKVRLLEMARRNAVAALKRMATSWNCSRRSPPDSQLSSRQIARSAPSSATTSRIFRAPCPWRAASSSRMASPTPTCTGVTGSEQYEGVTTSPAWQRCWSGAFATDLIEIHCRTLLWSTEARGNSPARWRF